MQCQTFAADVACAGRQGQVLEVRMPFLQRFQYVQGVILAVHVHHHHFILCSLLGEQGRKVDGEFLLFLVGYDEQTDHSKSSEVYP